MADVLAVRDEYRAQQWAMVIQECNNRGLSNREFCRQGGNCRKELLLLAAQAAGTNRRVCIAAVGTSGTTCCAG